LFQAIAAALYIAGFQQDAITLLYPFSFGAEFIKLNSEALDAYSRCSSEEEIQTIMNSYLSSAETARHEKETKKATEKINAVKMGSYLDEDDLPPMVSDEEYYEEEEEEENEEQGK
jgi:pre-rRNA-processing protein TSR3